MPDPLMYDMLRGLSAYQKEKNEAPKEEEESSEKALDASIRREVDLLISELNPDHNQFLSRQQMRKKLEMEIREAIDCHELGQHIKAAISLLEHEGRHHIDESDHGNLMQEIENLRMHMKSIDVAHIDKEMLKAALNFSESGQASILQIGVAKFIEERFPESLSIFAFLSTIASEDPDYWYRLGLAAQKCENYELALSAYGATANLAPEFVGARIFSAQCNLICNQRDMAMVQLNVAKDLLKTSILDEEWRQHVTDIENLITYADLTHRR